MRKQKFMITHFYCNDCGTEIPLPRRIGRMRERDHVKDIWCPKCKAIKKFTEKY